MCCGFGLCITFISTEQEKGSDSLMNLLIQSFVLSLILVKID